MKQILIRLLRLVVVVVVVTFSTFLLLDLAPGDPALARAGFTPTPEILAEIRAELGLDDPLPIRYLNWLGDAVRLDFGESVSREGFTVWELIRESLPKTLEIMVLAEIIAVTISVPTAIAAAQRPGGRLDRFSSASAFGLLAIPAFVLGIYFQYLFGVQLGWLPVIATDLPGFNDDPAENLKQYFLPALTLGLNLVAVYVRLLRSDLIDTLQTDYVMLAQARGLDDRRIMWRHVLRPSSLNTITAAGLNVAGLIGGAFIIEVLFTIPGMGQLLIDSVFRSDYDVVAAIVALLSIGYVSINFTIDVVYSILDPRIRHAER